MRRPKLCTRNREAPRRHPQPCEFPKASRPFRQRNGSLFRASFAHLDQDQFPYWRLGASFLKRGAAMRWLQKWIVSKEDETLYDVLLDATMALFSAAVATEVIQIVVSTL
jgi:hypothetical protein